MNGATPDLISCPAAAAGNQPRHAGRQFVEIPNAEGSRFWGPTSDRNGFAVYTVESAYQRTTTNIRVLLPTDYSSTARYRVVYVLPCEAESGAFYGDGLRTVKSLGVAETKGTIFAAPTFSDVPWYCDHSSNCRVWQETYFCRVVVPAIELLYPTVVSPAGRLLLGFSKSGYGAFSLLLRNPDRFGRALAWDSPLAMNRPRFGFGSILGDPANFENYRMSSLLRSAAPVLRGGPPRLFLMGYSLLRPHLRATARLMTELGIPHVNDVGSLTWHCWHRGWMSRAVEYLLDGP